MPPSDDSSEDSSSSSDVPGFDLETAGDLDSLFLCLADRRRRIMLAGLSGKPTPVVVEDLVEHIHEREVGESAGAPSADELVEITITLLHNHLPKMNEAGVIDVDHDADTVQKGDRFEAAKLLLQVM